MAAELNELKSQQTAHKKKQKIKSSFVVVFETACAKLKEASSTDEKEQKEYEIIRDITKMWPTHQNPNKNCAAAARIIKPHHCSSKIREKLSNHIKNNCSLNYCCFSKGAACCRGFNINEYQCVLESESLSKLFAYAANCCEISSSLVLKQIIGTKQFDFIFAATCCGIEQNFWIKMIGDSAFVKACGTSQRTDCMTFAPLFAIKLADDGLMVLKATKGLLGVGFCNLIEDERRKTKRKKIIKGNAMIMLRNDNIQNIEVALYAKNGVTDFSLSLTSDNLAKNNYDNPLGLYLQSCTGLVYTYSSNQQSTYYGVHSSSQAIARYSPY